MLELNLAEKPHARLSFSKASIWTNCSGWFFLRQGLAPGPINPEAVKGTKVHAALELTTKALLDHKIHGTPYPVEINAEPEIIELAYQATDIIWKRVLQESITDKAYGIETKLFFNKDLGIWGYADFWVVYIDDKGKKAAAVFDYKNGRVDVPIEKNPQLAGYGVSLFLELLKREKDLDYIRVIIFQPNTSGQFDYKESIITRSQLKAWEAKFTKAAYEILVQKKSKFKAGDWCTYCECKGACSTYKKDMSKKSSLLVLEDGEDFKDFPSPETIADTELVKIVTYGKKIKEFVDQCLHHVIARNLSNKPVEGTKLIQSRSRRKWNSNVQEIAKALLDANPEFNLEDIVTYKLKGITETEAKLAKVTGRKEAKLLLDELTSLNVPSLQVVGENDPRPAIENSKDLLINLENFDEEYE